MTAPVDILAIASHRDDVELTCGGTLVKHALKGHRTAIIDLTQGEMGTRGSAELRAAEADAAAAVLGVATRRNLGLPDAGIENTPETRRQLALLIRGLRPRVVIAPAPRGRHPDHRVGSQLIRDACFVAGLAKLDPTSPPHRPRKVLHSITYREDHVKPTFVVDISAEFDDQARGHQVLRLAVRRGDAGRRGVPHRRAAVRRGAHAGRALRIPDPLPLRRALLHLRDDARG
jgi:N-acetylglucosamine malate deacetylase 1